VHLKPESKQCCHFIILIANLIVSTGQQQHSLSHHTSILKIILSETKPPSNLNK